MARQKEDIIKATTQTPLTKPNVSQALQVGLRGKAQLTSEEHGRILQAQTSFYVSTIDKIRRELAIYG